jgi:hypothetical protein
VAGALWRHIPKVLQFLFFSMRLRKIMKSNPEFGIRETIPTNALPLSVINPMDRKFSVLSKDIGFAADPSGRLGWRTGGASEDRSRRSQMAAAESTEAEQHRIPVNHESF